MDLINHKVIHKKWRPSSKAKRFFGILVNGREKELGVSGVPATREDFNAVVQAFPAELIAEAREKFKLTLKASAFQHSLCDELEQKPKGRRLSRAQVRGMLATFTKEQIRQAKRRLWGR